jgi:isopentenyl diphosphate isomerase/L-lactate dehydrogenase-like FMN-dependent dehydrogenase
MPDLSRAVNIEDLRLLAKRRLPRAIFDFFDGGAEDEVTLRENRAAFERVRACACCRRSWLTFRE